MKLFTIKTHNGTLLAFVRRQIQAAVLTKLVKRQGKN